MLRIFFSLFLLSVPVFSNPTAPTTLPLESYENFQGVWLRNHQVEAFVSATPFPRVLIFRFLNERSPLRINASSPYSGAKTCFMEPTSPPPPQRAALTDVPAVVTKVSPRSVELKTSPRPEVELSQEWQVTLDPLKPQLTLLHRIRNHATRSRTLAPWLLVTLPQEGTILTAMGRGFENGQELIPSVNFYSGTSPRDRRIQWGRKALAVAFPPENHPDHLKVGTRSNAGWVAWIGSDLALLSSTPHQPGAVYPEGNGNITIYSNPSQPTDKAFAEMENVGTIQNVSPQGTASIEQTLTLIHLPKTPTPSDPDLLLTTLDEATQSDLTLGTPPPIAPDSSDLLLHLHESGPFRVDTNGKIRYWIDRSPYQTQVIAPFQGANAPKIPQSPGVKFDQSWLEIPIHPHLNSQGPFEERTYRLRFTPGKNIQSRQMIFKEGGVKRGMNFYLENGKLHTGLWNFENDANPGRIACFSAAIKGGVNEVRLTFKTNPGKLTLWMNGKRIAEKPIQGPWLEHNVASSLGLLHGPTRIDGAFVDRPFAFPFEGTVHELIILKRAQQ